MSNLSPKELAELDFKALYFEFYPILFRVSSYILKDGQEAEDVVQEVFLKLWEKRDRLDSIQNLKSYLIRMTQNLALDVLKASKKDEHILLGLELKDLAETENKDQESVEIRKALEIAVAQLSPKCRLIFALSRFEGLSNEEIAEYLDISKRTVETQISNALKAFRGDLKPIFEQHLSHLSISAFALALLQL